MLNTTLSILFDSVAVGKTEIRRLQCDIVTSQRTALSKNRSVSKADCCRASYVKEFTKATSPFFGLSSSTDAQHGIVVFIKGLQSALIPFVATRRGRSVNAPHE